jgi:hypothetical protein
MFNDKVDIDLLELTSIRLEEMAEHSLDYNTMPAVKLIAKTIFGIVEVVLKQRILKRYDMKAHLCEDEAVALSKAYGAAFRVFKCLPKPPTTETMASASTQRRRSLVLGSGGAPEAHLFEGDFEKCSNEDWTPLLDLMSSRLCEWHHIVNQDRRVCCSTSKVQAGAIVFVFIISLALFCELYLPVFNYMDGRHENNTCTLVGIAGKHRCDYWSTCDAGSAADMPSGRPLAFPLGSFDFGPAFTVLVLLGGLYHIVWLVSSIIATRNLIGDYVTSDNRNMMVFFSAHEGKMSTTAYTFCCCLCGRNQKPTPRPLIDTPESMFAGAWPPHRFVLETVSLALYLTAVLQVFWWYFVGALLPALFYLYPLWFLLMVVPTSLIIIMLVRNSVWTGYALAGYDCPYRSLSMFCMLTEPMALSVPEKQSDFETPLLTEKHLASVVDVEEEDDGHLSIRLGSKTHKVIRVQRGTRSLGAKPCTPGQKIVESVDGEFLTIRDLGQQGSGSSYMFHNIQTAEKAKKQRDYCWEFIYKHNGVQSYLNAGVAFVGRYYSELVLVFGCSLSLLLMPEFGLSEDSSEFLWSRRNKNAWTGGCV